jgi:PII-like signaling protein
MIIELIDSENVLEAFIDVVDPVIHGGLMTMEKMKIRMYRPKKS